MTPSPQPESPEPLKVVATTPHEWIWEFLDGSAGYMGVFFGEKHPDHQGRYWWRHFLRQEVEAMRKNLFDAEAAIQAARNEAEAMRADAERLRSLINTPHTDDWVTASKLEAAHQIERWSAEHDAGKQPEDWFWLLGYLGGKAVAAFRAGNKEKGLHHIISSSAALLNWHRNIVGDSTSMRPGIDDAAMKGDANG